MAAQFVLGFSLLIGLHEFGHFFFAKLFGIRVSKFYIFFDFLFPLPRVLNFSLLKKKIGDTEYGIGWFPLGGYVAIHGMVDETQGAAGLAAEPQPDEFRAKPAWQRLLVMLGGVGMNVLTAVVIFAGLALVEGTHYLPADRVQPDGVVTSALGRRIGLRDGDRLVAVNGRPLVAFEDVYDVDVLNQAGTYFSVERQGQRVNLPPLPTSFLAALLQAGDTAYVAPRKPFLVEQVTAGDSAAAAGLLPGDRIVALDGQPIRYFDELQRGLLRHRGGHVTLDILRGGHALSLPTGVNAAGKLGFRAQYELPQATRTYSLATAGPEGLRQALRGLHLQLVGIGKIISREIPAASSLSGPVEIAQQFGGHWDWPHFWELTATISLALAIMNLLPIPALDGGHALFLLYELVSRHKPSPLVLERAQRVGTLVVLSLMMYVLVVKQLLKLFPG